MVSFTIELARFPVFAGLRVFVGVNRAVRGNTLPKQNDSRDLSALR